MSSCLGSRFINLPYDVSCFKYGRLKKAKKKAPEECFLPCLGVSSAMGGESAINKRKTYKEEAESPMRQRGR